MERFCFSVTWSFINWVSPPLPMCLGFLADIFGSSEGTDVFGKEAIKSQSWFQKESLTAPKLWKPQRGVAGSETSPLHIHITCSLWSSCWAAGRTTAAAACEPPPPTAAPAGTPRRIWRCVPAPSWRAASACPDTCPSLPAGTTPTSRCGHTWCEREDIYGALQRYFVGRQWCCWALFWRVCPCTICHSTNYSTTVTGFLRQILISIFGSVKHLIEIFF